MSKLRNFIYCFKCGTYIGDVNPDGTVSRFGLDVPIEGGMVECYNCGNRERVSRE